MHIIQVSVIIITAIFVITWIFQHILEPGALRRVIRQKTTPKALGRIEFIETDLYGHIQGKAIAERAALAHGWKQNELLYGDVDLFGFYQLLNLAKAQPTDVFYDLGSGTGKAVFTAALCYQIQESTGIELVPELHATSERVLMNFIDISSQLPKWKRNSSRIRFICGNFFNFDISDATLIFINATAFSIDQWINFYDFFDHLSSGTRIIVTSHTLPDDRFILLYEGSAVMSWGLVSSHIYQKI